MLIIITGGILEMTIGTRFVFSAADQYRAMIPWLLGILVPAFAWMWFNLEHASHSIADRYPTWWVRWLLAFPLIVALSSAIVAIFPLGWFALYGFLYGIPDGDIEAKMLAVSPHHPNSRGCNQNADLIINGNSARICLAQVLSGSAPAAGEAVTVTGRVSGVGVFSAELRPKHGQPTRHSARRGAKRDVLRTKGRTLGIRTIQSPIPAVRYKPHESAIYAQPVGERRIYWLADNAASRAEARPTSLELHSEADWIPAFAGMTNLR